MNVQFSMLAFVVFICIALVWASTRYVHDATMDGLSCRVGDTMFTLIADIMLVCAMSCERTSTCKSWFYSSTSKKCYGCNNSYFSSNSSFSGNANTKYYRNGDPGWLSMIDLVTGYVWVTNPAFHSSRYHVGTTAGPMDADSAWNNCHGIRGYLICLNTTDEVDMVKGYLLNGGGDDNVSFWTAMTTDWLENTVYCSRGTDVFPVVVDDWAPSEPNKSYSFVELKRELQYQWGTHSRDDNLTALCKMD